MKYNVVTPFSRFQNLKMMYAHIKSHGVQWHLLLDQNNNFKPLFSEPWVICHYAPPCQPFWRAWRNHLNEFIRIGTINPEERYIILNDDDFVEPGFFEKIDKHTGEFLVCSMMRGQRIPPGGHNHPTDTLMACPENMQVGRVGCEQMIVSGRLLSQIRFADDLCADGIAIVELAKKHPPVYVPEAYVWFNFLEPGRWHR